ncbi:T9SS type A sorting domain-containing protein [candidate division WOR-3 bacterium]|nr:T9SS type A sorting domain-containing protein [candidate division WOR-3 bacterium]
MLPCFDTLDCIEYVPWKERRYMPSDPSGKAVSSGGWLTYDAGDGQVYAAKGHGVADFYRYDPAQDSWHQLWAVQRGREGKLPKKGCRGASSGDGSVYMVKGNNTTGFWRYDAAENDWHQLPDVPLGPSRKRVMVGADMVFVSKGESSFVYLLKGRGCEFWRYSTADSSWGSLPNAPLGSHPKWNEGSWLAFDGAQTIYALKAKYHEFWRFDVSGDTWYSQSLPAMPFGPAGKKTKDGGSACFRNDMVYALKGGKTQELWMYDPVADEWEQRDTIPSRDSSSLRKTVKGGGDIVLAGDEILALKGNNTRALWQYWPRPSDGAFARRDGPPTRGVDGAETGLAEGMSALTPRWNEQGTAVVYVREAEDGVGAGYDQVYLVRASAPGTEVRVVDIAMDCSEPVFRPSGSHICFVLDDTVTDRLQIATVPVPDADFAREQQEKTEERAVTNDGAGTATEQKESSVRLTRPVQLPVSAGRDRVVVPGLYAAGLPGAQAWGPQTPTLLTDDEWDHFSPSYSPSSGLICYCKDDATDRSQLYLISSGGGTEQALTDYSDADCESPSFLDNDHVTFIYSKDGEYDRVGKLNINSQQLTILTEGEYDAETPDPAKGGQSIAFGAQDNDGTYQVGLVRSDGTDERLVTSSSLDLEEPDWSGDGYSIAAVRWFGLTSQIGMVDTASGDFTRLTDSSCIRDKPDVYYNQPAGISFVVYEREDPNATDGIRPKPRRRPGTGIFLVRHKKKQDGVMGAGLATELRRALPNPASGPVTVYWQVAQAGTDATVKVYDASGRQVRVLFSGKAKPGLNEATWTCKDQKGRAVPNGVYFCTLETKDDRISRKLILAAGE